MDHTTIVAILSKSSPDEWLRHDDQGSFTYKADADLHIEREAYDLQDTFNESWAVNHPDKTAHRVYYRVMYNSSLIERKLLVSVDGGRATLPLPDRKSLEVFLADVNFARIVDVADATDEYIERAKLKVIRR